MKKPLNIATVFAALIYTTSVFAAAYEPTITYYPKSFIVPYATNGKTFTLKFDVVNNFNQPITLSNAQFLLNPNAPSTQNVIGNINPTFDSTPGCTVSNNGKTAVMSAQGTLGICHLKIEFSATGTQPGGGKLIPEDFKLSLDYTASGQQPGTLTSDTVTIRFGSGTVQPTLARTITVLNNCNYPVWLGAHGAAAQSINPTAHDSNGNLILTSCQSNADCYPGSSCQTYSAVPQCAWDEPVPANNNYLLAAKGGMTTLSLPVYDSGNGFSDKNGNYIPYQISWSGGFAGRVNCTQNGCELGDCSNSDGACTPGRGFDNPHSIAEITMLKEKTLVMSNDTTFNNDDTYDVSIINGVIVPVSITPDNFSPSTWAAQNEPFFCGPAGGTRNQTSTVLPGCSWNFTPPRVGYEYVTYDSTAQTCTTKSDCTIGTGMICGLTRVPGTTTMRKQCGVPSSFYWTADVVCGIDPTYNEAPYYCATAVPNTGANNTYTQAYICDGAEYGETCYAQKASSSCCGCSNWHSIFNPTGNQPNKFEACVNSNQDWTNIVLPRLNWIKEACPLAYVYPYDDKSSTFTCKKQNSNNVNVQNYTITFCPS